MQSEASTVDAYIDEAPTDRRAALQRLRALCRATFPEATEAMNYGMAVFERAGAMQVAFASQKNHIALYGLGADVIERHRSALRGVDFGKGCIRYRKPDSIDFTLVETMMVEARERPGS